MKLCCMMQLRFAADEDERTPRATAEQALEISRSLLLFVYPA